MKEEKKRFPNDVEFFCYGIRLHQPVNITTLENMITGETGAVIQAVDSRFIVNKKHAMLILNQSYEAFSRGISIARKSSLDVLLRAICTRKIEKALRDAGVKENSKECVIMGFCSKGKLKIVADRLKNYGEFDDKVLDTTKQKIDFLIKYHNITAEEMENYDLVQLLCEKSASSLVRYYKVMG